MSDEKVRELLCWIDLETTGLDEEIDQILEIGIIISGMGLGDIDRQNWTIPWSKRDNVISGPVEIHPVVEEMHTKNGLWDECQLLWDSGVREEQVIEEVYEFLSKYSDCRLYPAGSSVHFDMGFIKRQYPWKKLVPFFYHRHMDVSSVKMIQQLIGGEYDGGKPDPHRAIGDLENDIDWLRTYTQPF
jgi:oligoribonuclease